MFQALLGKFLSTKMWRKFAAHWLAFFTFRVFGWPKLPKSRYFAIKAAAETVKGKCGILAFVSVDRFILNYKINHLLTKCKWGHAGYVYFGADGELRIKHMLNTGLNDDYLLDLLGEVDGFSLLWIPIKDGESYDKVMRRIQKLDDAELKVQYDYALSLERDVLDWLDDDAKQITAGSKQFKLYCSEYVYAIAKGLAVKEFSPKLFAGREVFEPDALYAHSDILFDESY